MLQVFVPVKSDLNLSIKTILESVIKPIIKTILDFYHTGKKLLKLGWKRHSRFTKKVHPKNDPRNPP